MVKVINDNMIAVGAPTVTDASASDLRISGRPTLRRYVLPRRRIVERLEQAMEAQLVLVRGAAGSGKTTALAVWAESVDGRRAGAWVSGDEENRERVDAWASVASGFGSAPADVAAARRDARSGDLTALQRLVPHTPAVLVLDDVQMFADQEALAVDVERILLRRPRLTVVLVGRSRTVFETSAAVGRIDVERVDVDTLRFTEQEVAAALTARGITFDAAVSRYVVDSVDGWPLAVSRLGNHLALEDRRLWHPVDLARVTDRLLDSLGDELTSGLRDESFGDDLACASVLPFLTVDLVSKTLDTTVDSAAAFVAALESAGVASWRRAFGRDRLVLVPAVKRALGASLELDGGSVRGRRYESIAAHLLEDEGEGAVWDALQLARAAGDWAHVTSITLRFHAVLSRDHFDDLRRLLDGVPRAVLDDDPWLLALKGLLWVASEGARSSASTANFARAEAVARERIRDAAGREELALGFLRVMCLRRSGAYGRSAALARTLDDAADGARPTRPALSETLVAEAQVQLGITYLHDGAHAEALERFSRVLAEPRADAHTRIAARGYTAMIRALRGELVPARAGFDAVTTDPAWADWSHTAWGVPAHLAGALLAMERQEHSAAGRHLRIVAAIGVDVEDWPLVTYVRGLHHLVTGRGAEGFACIRDEEGRRGHDHVSNHLLGLLFVLKSDFLLLGRQAKTALPALKPFVDGRESVVGAHARALLLSGNAVHARLFVDRLVWRDRLSPRSQLELQVVKAVASYRLGDQAGAREALMTAAGITDTHGVRLPWGLVPRDELQAVVAATEPSLDSVLRETPGVFAGGLTVPALTRRERVVISQLRGQGSIEDIAIGLHVSTNTIKTQVQSVYRKLGVTSRTDAVRVAYEWRLLAAGDQGE